jgi:predicted RNase H-like nuclease (RuvC/YqgF family)
MSSTKAELNNTVRTYQDFCDRNLKLSKREHELQLSISQLEVKKIELQKIIMELQDHASTLRESNTNSNILDLETKQMEEVISMTDGLIPSSDMTNNYQQNENETTYYLEPSLPKALIFDTKDLT